MTKGKLLQHAQAQCCRLRNLPEEHCHSETFPLEVSLVSLSITTSSTTAMAERPESSKASGNTEASGVTPSGADGLVPKLEQLGHSDEESDYEEDVAGPGVAGGAGGEDGGKKKKKKKKKTKSKAAKWVLFSYASYLTPGLKKPRPQPQRDRSSCQKVSV